MERLHSLWKGERGQPGFARRQYGSKVLWPRKQGVRRTPARLPAPGLSCNLTVGRGLVSTLQTQFPFLEDGTSAAPPISGFAYKGQELIWKQRGQGPWDFGGP